MTDEIRLALLVNAYLASPELPVEVQDPLDVMECVLAVEPGAVPPACHLPTLARDFVIAFVIDDGQLLPTPLERHVHAWLRRPQVAACDD